MPTRVYMKWLPLLVVSGGTGIFAELVVAFAVTVALSNRQEKNTSSLAVTGSRVNQSRFLKITYKFEKLSRNLKNKGNC